MGLFNEVRVKVSCPRCGYTTWKDLQFKYGAVRQYKYEIGDSLRWYGGRGDVGSIDDGCVVVDACAVRCRECGFDDGWDFYLIISGNRILGALPAPPLVEFRVFGHETFLRLGPTGEE